ncbi:class I adenylate-forming enzyme family protein [Bacillaceae bacterium W0354]
MHWELDWMSSRARLFPNDIAIIDADSEQKYTYYEINERANQLANYLYDNGIRKGDRVALLAPNHISYFDFLFACMKIGAIFVPLNWRLSEEELNYVVNDCQPKIMARHFSFKQDLLSMHEVPLLTIESNDYINNLSNKSNNYTPILQEKDPLAMIYTGGTTGMPKGAVLSHQSILWNAMNTIISWDIEKNDCTLTSIPMFHTGGLNALSIPLLLAGGTVVIRSTFEPETAIDDLRSYRCTIVLFIPTMYHMIVQTDKFQSAHFPHMKVFLSGGAPCPLTVYDAFQKKGLKFKEGYGLTEAGPNNFYIDPVEAKIKKGSVGKAMVFNEIKIVNDDGEEVGPNTIGELWLRGKHLFEYYWNNESASQAAYHGDWFKTGDLARCDEEGYVYISGRKKEMIITGGENVYPLEIEHWLQSHEMINEVAVVGVPDDLWGEMVVAFISFKDEKLTEEELKAYCQKKLTRYKIPKKFIVVDELPKTHVGKIDKKVLVETYKAGI